MESSTGGEDSVKTEAVRTPTLDEAVKSFFSALGVDVDERLKVEPAMGQSIAVSGAIDLDDEARKKLPPELVQYADAAYPNRPITLQGITLRNSVSTVATLAGPPVQRSREVILEVTPQQESSDAEAAKRTQGFTGIVLPGTQTVRDNWIIIYNRGPFSDAYCGDYGLSDWMQLQDPAQERQPPNSPQAPVSPSLLKSIAKVVADPSIGVRSTPPAK